MGSSPHGALILGPRVLRFTLCARCEPNRRKTEFSYRPLKPRRPIFAAACILAAGMAMFSNGTDAMAEGPGNGTPTLKAESANEASNNPEASKAAGTNSDGGTMKPFVVSAPVYKAYLTPSELRLLDFYERMHIHFAFGPFDMNFEGPFVATPLRMPQDAENSAFTAEVESGEMLRDSPYETLDGVLASEPEVGLLGRSDSLWGQPRDRFVSLRGVDASGSGALVLLDGLPFNDPFSRSVPWIEATSQSLARVEVVPGGGSTAWGNGALGGVVQLFTYCGEVSESR
jgi:outer membrane receptor protein involved in Fe transport